MLSALESNYALRCWAFLPLNDFEFDLLSVFERTKSFRSNGTMVDEDIISIGAFNKAKALGVVEELADAGLAHGFKGA